MSLPPFPGMRLIRGGTFTMGSERFYPEESPQRRVSVDDFWIDETLVTNRQFARFVTETGYVTVAEVAPDLRDYPGMAPELAKAGSLVFVQPSGSVDEIDQTRWWQFVDGADWRHPTGSNSNLDDRDDHPVVHITYADAEVYARWAGKALPTEAEFEYAARGGLEDADYAWGDSLAPDGLMLANYWQGMFPFVNECLDGWKGTSPVASFPVNAYGVYDLIGNVWEWTQDWYVDAAAHGHSEGSKTCCAVRNPRGAEQSQSYDPEQPAVRIGRKVIKGGSHLCAENYCQRYRPAARHPQMIDTSTTHIGFRCVVRSKTRMRRA